MSGIVASESLFLRCRTSRQPDINQDCVKRGVGQFRLDEMGDKFEDIEQQQFGKDGYEDAVKQIADIESSSRNLPRLRRKQPGKLI